MEFRPKEQPTSRISFLNACGLSQSNAHPKKQEIRTFIRTLDIDILEVNVNWIQISNSQQLHEQTIMW